MRHIGILGGSFNPVHNGHLILANHIRQRAGLDEVWLVMSPLNPLKVSKSDLAGDEYRYSMVALAANPVEGLEPSDVEMRLPRPSYTVNTLDYLVEQYPEADFSLIIGADSFLSFKQWKDYQRIISLTRAIYVYPRPGYELPSEAPSGFVFISAPVVEISSTEIRKNIREGFDVNFLIPDSVYSFIKKHKLYR